MDDEVTKRSKFLRGGAYAAAAVAFLTLGAVFVKPVSDRALETHRLHQRLDSLAVNVNLSVFEEQFGRPQIVNLHEKWRQYVFVEERVLVQAVTSSSDKVKFYSVTLRDDEFHHQFEWPGAERPRTFELGRDTLKSVKSMSNGVAMYAGAHNFGYSEAHWVGVGVYRNYVFGLSEAGAYDSQEIAPLWDMTEASGWSVKGGIFSGENLSPTPGLNRIVRNKEFRRARRRLPVNTFGVDSGDLNWAEILPNDGDLFGAPLFGPRLQDVTLFPE